MLPQDPTLQELQVAGAQLHLQDQPHLLLDDCFYVSGFIPRTTSYEQGNPGHATQMVRPAAATEQGGAACNATFTAHMLCLYGTVHNTAPGAMATVCKSQVLQGDLEVHAACTLSTSPPAVPSCATPAGVAAPAAIPLAGQQITHVLVLLQEEGGPWELDPVIADERFLMVNIQGGC
jgi:hypothetical protein